MQYQHFAWGSVAMGLPQIAMAQQSNGSPVLILGCGVLLLLLLSLYVGIKIYQSLKQEVSVNVKRRV